MTKRFRGAAFAALIAITATGCADRIEGRALAAEPPKPALAAAVSTGSSDFDPCVDLTNDDLLDAQLRPSTRTVLNVTESRACQWQSSVGPYDIGIFAHDFTVQSLEPDPQLRVLGHLRLGGRRALVFSFATGHGTDLCMVAFEGGPGTVVVVPYANDGSSPARSALCEVATTHAQAIVDAVPAV